jgi:hypothetical protein
MVTADVDLRYAPRARVIDPLREFAARRALTHAQHVLPLPPLSVTWVDHPRGLAGEMVPHQDGGVDVYLNAAAHASGSPWAIARDQVLVMFHELRHAADARAGLLSRIPDQVSEQRADDFAHAQMKTFRWEALSMAIQIASGRGRCDRCHNPIPAGTRYAREGSDEDPQFFHVGACPSRPLPDIEDVPPIARNGTARSTPGGLPPQCQCGGAVKPTSASRKFGRCGTCGRVFEGSRVFAGPAF